MGCQTHLIIIMRKHILSLCLIAFMAVTAVSCQKKVSLDKMREIVSQSVITEEKDSGRTLVIDTIQIEPNGAKDFKGIIKGVLNDSIPVVYDLTLTDNGDDYDAEWKRVD